MEALGMKALLALVQAERPSTALETLYRWRAAINDGRGISDRNKDVLIRATEVTEHAIEFADFYEPARAEEPQEPQP